ncbi:MAG: HNH endonuclease [Acidobacteria bacterium]|nr:HNH endonuclease [Acidobacteriota bacterium]
MEQTLLLNATYEPLQVVNWKKALTLLFSGKAEVVAEYEREINSVSFSIKLPSILRLFKFIRINRKHTRIKFSRANIYSRDNHCCQYCGTKCSSDMLTFDHVVPIVQGGSKSWDNIVTCCIHCNHKKGGRTPHEAGLKLIRKPCAPQWVATRITFSVGFRSAPESWRDYLYWNVELEAD